MTSWLRRLRGALGMAVTWAVAWFGIGAVIGVVFFGGGLNLALLFNGLLFAVAGFIGGATFSGVLAVAGRRRTFDQMSIPLFSGLGALGGLVVSLWLSRGIPLTATGAVVTGVVTLMAAGSAAGSLMLARRASSGDQLGAGDSPDLLEGQP